MAKLERCQPETDELKAWLSSKEAQKALKVSSCELMHLRVVGKLPYKKQGNAYFYQIPKQPEK